MARILMTGCSRSVGKVTADLLRERGHTIFGVGMGGPDYELDFAQGIENRISDIFKRATDTLGGYPEVLINNAGITRINPIQNQDFGHDWSDVIEVNLNVPYMLAQSMVKLSVGMVDREESDPMRVINVASMGARYALRHSTSYNASKAGLVAMARSMAKECAGTLPVVHYCVSPNGIAETNMINQAIDSLVENRGMTREEAVAYNAQAPMGRLCSMAEVAEVIRYCVEEAPAYMTGHNFELLGGMPA